MSLAFRTVGILAKPSDERLSGTLEMLIEHLHARGLSILLDQATLPDLPGLRDYSRATRDEIGQRSDLVIAVGCDGTLINAAHCLAPHGKPVLGINLGRLGFLVDISPDELSSRLDRILAGEYVAEERFLLCGRVLRGETVVHEGVVFNDLVYKVRDAVRMIEFETHIDGRYLFTQ
ncbi:MAG: NAD(+)/NADH kinase, partial [Halothiobacillaceae bacterium]